LDFKSSLHLIFIPFISENLLLDVEDARFTNILIAWLSASLTLGLWNTNLPTFAELGTLCTHIFLKIIFSTFFVKVRLIDSVEVKTLLLLKILIFYAVIYSEIHKMFEDKKIWFRT
jgi:hypothetical protein